MANTDWRKHTLTNGKEIKLCMSKDEIYASYNEAKYKGDQITVLADLNSVSVQDMCFYLLELGFDNSYIRQRTERAKKKTPTASKQAQKKKTMPEKSETASIDQKEREPRRNLLEDTLKLISDLEEEYKLCILLIEKTEANKKKIAQSLDALSTVYKNLEGLK